MTKGKPLLLTLAASVVLLTGCQNSRAFYQKTINGTEYSVVAKRGVEVTPEMLDDAESAVTAMSHVRDGITLTYQEAIDMWFERPVSYSSITPMP